MEMNFDPMTGEPITPDNTPVVQEPKKSKIGIIVGAVIAAVVVIAIAAVLIRSAIIGKGGKVAIALTNTFAETPDIVKTANLDSTAKLLESGKYTVAVTVDEAGKSGVTVEGKVVSTPKEKQISGEVSAKGFTTNGVLGITKEQLKLYAPILGDDTYVYNYKDSEVDGYILETLDDAGVEIDSINELLAMIYEGQDKEYTEAAEKFSKDLMKKIRDLEWEKLDKKSFEVDGKDRKVSGYGATVTGEDVEEIVGLYEEYYTAVLDEASALYDMAEIDTDELTEQFDQLYDACDEMDDMQLDFYIYKNKIAAIEFEIEEVEGEILFKGGDFRLQNIECTIEEYGEEYTFEIEGETDKNTESYQISADGQEIISFEYDKKSGDFEVEAAGESFEGNIQKKGKGFEMTLEIEEVDVTLSITEETELEDYEGDEVDIIDLDEDDILDIISNIEDEL